MAREIPRAPDGRRLFRAVGGAKPRSVRSEAIAVMKEIGIDISGQRSKSVDEFSGQSFDCVVTVCHNAGDNFLYFRPAQHAFTGAWRARGGR
jgi:arsenate reductase